MFFNDALVIHLLVMGIMLVLIFWLLQERGLLHWLSAGFWVGCSIGLYFFAVPLMNWLTRETFYLETRLAVTEGIPRLLWVTFCIVVGVVCFYAAYFRTTLRKVTLGIRHNHLPRGTWFIMALALMSSAYSLLMLRSSFAMASYQVMMEKGKFTGEITGHEYMAHLLALFPLALMIFYKKTRKIGYFIAFVYIAVRFEDGWDRHTVVALLLGISMIGAILKQRLWPRWPWMIAILLITIVLTIRGHETFLDFSSKGQLNVIQGRETITKGSDTVMLATLWLESYLADKVGYNYGIPTMNRALFGYLPRKYCPWKDDLLENVFPLNIPNSREFILGFDMMYGAKSTVIGDLYTWGGIICVGLGMIAGGYLARRLDGMLLAGCPITVHALGCLCLGDVWMLFAGYVYWSLSFLFLTMLPFVVLIIWQRIIGSHQREGGYFDDHHLDIRPKTSHLFSRRI